MEKGQRAQELKGHFLMQHFSDEIDAGYIDLVFNQHLVINLQNINQGTGMTHNHQKNINTEN